MKKMIVNFDIIIFMYIGFGELLLVFYVFGDIISICFIGKELWLIGYDVYFVLI